MKLSHADYKLFDKMNKRLAAWEKSGAEHSIITEVKDALLTFYDEENIDVSRMKSIRFKRSNDMTEEQIKQQRMIAKMMEAQPESKVGFFRRDWDKMSKAEKAYQTSKKKYGAQVQDFASWVKFYEGMKAMSERVKEYYGSKQIVDIYEYGLKKGLKRSEITKILHNQSRSRTVPDDERYDRTIDKINSYYNKKNKR